MKLLRARGTFTCCAPMPSLTVENYLKAILQISQRSRSDWVSTGALAAELEVSPGTVTSMLKGLSAPKSGRRKQPPLVNYKPYEGVQLTSDGRRLAVRMLRRHRLIELFLVHTLKLTWDRVHEEAEHMEHAVSDFLVDRIDEYLGRPPVDPHGDPIPTAEGEMRGNVESAVPLTSCPPGTRVRIVRVTNQEPGFLRFLSEAGLELDTEATVHDNNREAAVVTLKVRSRTIPIAHSAAQSLLIDPLNS